MKTNHEFKLHSGWTSALMTVVIFTAAIVFPETSLAAKPDFTGTWKLNEGKSQVGEMRFRPASLMQVKQDKSSLTVASTRTGRNGQERKMEWVYNLDGKETTNQGGQRSRTSTAKWSEEGTSLIIHSTSSWTREGQTFESESTETWMIGENGKTLTIKNKSSNPRGESSYQAVYDLVE